MSASSDYPLSLAKQLRPMLQSLRKARGLTQAQLGQRIGVTQARVVEIEANPGAVSFQRLMQVLHALDAQWVVRDTAAPPPPDAPLGHHANEPRKGRW